MIYKIKRSSQFKKDFKTIVKRGYDLTELENVIKILKNGGVLPEKYKDHPLKNSKEYLDCRELHIEPDWLLVYKYYDNQVILYLMRTGTHSDLF